MGIMLICSIDDAVDCPNFIWYGPWYFEIIPFIDSFGKCLLFSLDYNKLAFIV